MKVVIGLEADIARSLTDAARLRLQRGLTSAEWRQAAQELQRAARAAETAAEQLQRAA